MMQVLDMDTEASEEDLQTADELQREYQSPQEKYGTGQKEQRQDWSSPASVFL